MILDTEELVFTSFDLGSWMTNCYFLGEKSTGKAWLVDPGFQPEKAISFIAEGNWTLEKVLLTHGHLDHIGGLGEVRDRFPQAKIHIHASEAGYDKDPLINMAAPFGITLRVPPADVTLTKGEELFLGGFSCRVLHTPGHSPGGVSYYFEDLKILLVGDTLFQGSIGRYDFPLSDGNLLFKSLRETLMSLPGDTLVYPGHGAFTSIDRERRENGFLR